MEGARRAFGQKIDLCTRIRDILEAYPDGSTVLKELLQNADDAGATTFKLLLDKREHGRASLAFPGAADFQGAAFYAFNDATFADEDFVRRARAPRAPRGEWARARCEPRLTARRAPRTPPPPATASASAPPRRSRSSAWAARSRRAR